MADERIGLEAIVAGAVRPVVQRVRLDAELGERVVGLAVGPTLCVLATRTEDGQNSTAAALLWDPTSGRRVGPIDEELLLWGPDFAFSPDGRWLALALDEGGAVLWDVARGCVGRRLEGAALCQALAFSPDGAHLVAGTSDGDLLLWTIADERAPVQPRVARAGIGAVAFDRDGRRVAATGPGGVTVWDRIAEKTVVRRDWPEPLLAAVFIGDRRVLAGSGSGAGVVLDAATGRHVATLLGGGAAMTAVAIDPSGEIVATGGDDGAVHFWAGEDLRALGSLDLRALAQQHVGAATGEPGFDDEDEGDAVSGIGWSTESQALIVATANGLVWRWPWPAGSRAEAPVGALPRVVAVTWGPPDDWSGEGTSAAERAAALAAAAGLPTQVRAMLASAPTVCSLAEVVPETGWSADDMVMDLAIAADGRRCAVAVGTPDGQNSWATPVVLELATGALVAAELGRMDIYPLGLGFVADGRLAFTAADTGVIVTAVDGEAAPRILEPGVHCATLAIDADGTRVAIASHERLSLWTIEGVRLWSVAAPGDVEALRFSPDGARIGLAAGDVWLWDAARGAPCGRLPAGRATRLAFAPDGRRLVTDGTRLQVWDVASARALVTFHGHRGATTALGFDPSGEVVIAASDDGVSLWDARRGALLGWIDLGEDSDEDGVAALTWRPDVLVIATANGRICRWSSA